MSYFTRLQSVIQNKLALRSTGTSVSAGGIAVSTSSGSFSTTSASYVNVTNLSVTLVTTGRPIWVGLVSDNVSSGAELVVFLNTGNAIGIFQFLRGATVVGVQNVQVSGTGSVVSAVPSGSLYCLDIVSAGTYTYTLQALSAITGANVSVRNSLLVAYEI